MIGHIATASVVFNLLCTGTQQHIDLHPLGPFDKLRAIQSPEEFPSVRYVKEIRVDLRKRRWCYQSSCLITFDFAHVSETNLVLDDGCSGVGSASTCIDFRIDRETGEFKLRDITGDDLVNARGSCVKRKSPGLPRPKF